MNRAKANKIRKIVLNVLLYLFLAVCIFTVFLTVLSKKDSDGAAEIFGYQMRVVTSDSMAESEFTDVSGFDIKDIPIRSVVFIKTVPDDAAEADEFYKSLRVGDVLTFRYVYTTQVTITHRITKDVEKVEGGYRITLAGDNKNSEDGQLTQIIDTSIPNNTNYVIGKVTASSYVLGVILGFLMQPLGIVLVIIVPCFLIILLEILKIVRVLGADKKKREQEEKQKKEEELEELRRRLAELEQNREEQSSPTPAETVYNNEEIKEDKTE